MRITLNFIGNSAIIKKNISMVSWKCLKKHLQARNFVSIDSLV